jgi:hypothetical protein
MVKHIVAWKLKSSAGGRDSQENASIMKERVEGLKDKIKGDTANRGWNKRKQQQCCL